MNGNEFFFLFFFDPLYTNFAVVVKLTLLESQVFEIKISLIILEVIKKYLKAFLGLALKRIARSQTNMFFYFL